MRIGNDYSVDLFVQGEAVPLDISDFTIKVFENAVDFVPVVEISIVDNESMTDLPSLSDGTQLIVSFSNALTQESWKLPVRVFNYASQAADDGTDVIEVSCYYDAPDLFKDIDFAAHRGNSSTVAKLLADASGLQFEGDTSTDTQVWLRGGITGQAFLAHLTRHAYRNATSAYCATVTRQGVLRYYDLTARKRASPLWQFTSMENVAQGAQNVLLFDDRTLQYYARSGFTNAWRGYGVYANHYDVLTGLRVPVAVDQVDKSTDYLNVNSDVSNPTKSIVGPIDCGNTHPNYFKAAIQNNQNLAMYSNEINFVCSQLRDVALLDRVAVTLSSDRDSTLRQTINGVYFIDKIATLLTKSGTRVRYNAVREGFNSSHTKTGRGLY